MAEIDDANWQLAVGQEPGMPQQMMLSQLASQLQKLVPFLAATTASQDYLLHRLRELRRRLLRQEAPARQRGRRRTHI